ncbi:MAG TPA: hypothetical protein VIL35_02240 [Vicinamibacterales bacterium]
MKDTLYEVHVEDAPDCPWREVGRFDSLEDARIEAVHLIRETSAHRVRVIHVVDYYAKPAVTQTAS